jgi:DNA repair protein RadD
MNYILRPYQAEAAKAGIDCLLNSEDNGLIVCPTGGGKALIIAAIVEGLDGPCIVFQPSREILQQNAEKLVSFGRNPSIFSASMGRKRIGAITLATIGSVVRKPELFQQFKYIVIDECFAPGTLVDGRPIETIEPGQYVTAFDHSEGRIVLSKVEAVIKKPAPVELCCVRVFGESIVSTLNHQYYVCGRGYIEAQHLKYGDSIIRSKIAWQQDGAISAPGTSLHTLRNGRAVVECYPVSSVEKEGQGVSQGVWRNAQRNLIVGANAEEKSNEEARCTREDGQNFETDWPQAESERREWKTYAIATKNAFGGSMQGTCGLVSGVSHTNTDPKEERVRLSDVLQNRHRKSSGENCCGNRWHWPFRKTQRGGFEKGESFEIARVEGVEILEQGSLGKYGGCERCDYVYDLQVARHSNYFAAGVLVHNCHLSLNPKNEDGMFMRFLEKLPNVKICGTTATPYRLCVDGYGGSILKFLTRTRPRIFKKVVHVTQNGDLFRDGYLAKLEYKQVKSGFRSDRLRLNSTGADYTDESVKQHFRELNFSDQIVRCVNRVAELNRGPVLVFTRFVEEANYVASRIPRAEVVTAETKSTSRESIIRAFKRGAVPAVCNVGVLQVGFDYPELANVILARPTRSLALFYQMVGRAVRPHPSKESAYVIDMVGLVNQFGKVEDLRLVCGPHDTWFVESNGKQLTNKYLEGQSGRQYGARAGVGQTEALPVNG